MMPLTLRPAISDKSASRAFLQSCGPTVRARPRPHEHASFHVEHDMLPRGGAEDVMQHEPVTEVHEGRAVFEHRGPRANEDLLWGSQMWARGL